LKKVISILLSLLILFNSIGYILFYIERIANNKKEMFELVATTKDLSSVEKFQFSNEEYKSKLNWKNENEFEFKSKMYDVIIAEVSDSLVIVYCIWDAKEDELIANFEKHFHNNALKDKFNLSHNSLLTAHFLAIKTEQLKPERTNNPKILSENYLNYYNSISKKTLTPPPKFL
jgi:hypothetical protein